MSTPRTRSLSVGTDQLSLFSEPTASEIDDNLVEESIDDRNDDTLATWLSDPGALETSQADDGREPGEGPSAPAGGFRGSGVDGEPALRVDGGSEDGLPGGVGDRDEGVGVPSGRAKPAPIVLRSGGPQT